MRLNGTGDLIESMEYPLTTEELLDMHGEHLIELQNGSQTLGEVLGLFGSQTYRSAEDVRDALFTGVSHRAIGRRFYSDRDAFTLGEHGPTPLSF